jgi:poly(ADP-ribose) glycohydrolase ARH3
MTVSPLDRTRGCLLGLALGDAFGAPHGGGPFHRLLWRFIGRTADGECRWTDETQMTLDLVASLVAHDGLDEDDLARRFAESHRWSRGYEPSTSKTIERILAGDRWQTAAHAAQSGGSSGAGAAARAPAVALFCVARPVDLEDLARRTAAVTHAHPQAREGAALVARATFEAATGAAAGAVLAAVERAARLESFRQRLQKVRALDVASSGSVAAAARTLGSRPTALDSCVTAIFAGLAHLEDPFEDLVRTALAIGGGVDTIAAMAGAIWGAANGVDALPAGDLDRLEARYEIDAAARDLYAHAARSAA